MHKKNLIRDDDKDDKYKIKQQNSNIDTKPPNVFNYLKSLSQKAKDLMDEIEDADDDIDDGKLLKKNLTLTLLINYISVIIMENFH